jgi:acetyl-CoA carboxylase biotin carboxyl carrier protein
MPLESRSIAERIRRLAVFLSETDARRVRIERGDEEIEVSRRGAGIPSAAAVLTDGITPATEIVPLRLDAIKADLVGILRFGRPAPFEGEMLDEDRELAYIEALGMRNPVHSLGGGRIVTIAAVDGAAVEYGQPLFLVDRG